MLDRSADPLRKGNTVYSLCPDTTWEKQKEPCREVWMWELPEHRNKICSKVCGARKQSPFSACPGEHHPSDMRPESMGDTVQCFRTSWNHSALSETMYHTHVHQNEHYPASHSDSERESFHDFPCSTVRYPFSGGNVSIERVRPAALAVPKDTETQSLGCNLIYPWVMCTKTHQTILKKVSFSKLVWNPRRDAWRLCIPRMFSVWHGILITHCY